MEETIVSSSSRPPHMARPWGSIDDLDWLSGDCLLPEGWEFTLRFRDRLRLSRLVPALSVGGLSFDRWYDPSCFLLVALRLDRPERPVFRLAVSLEWLDAVEGESGDFESRAIRLRPVVRELRSTDVDLVLRSPRPMRPFSLPRLPSVLLSLWTLNKY